MDGMRRAVIAMAGLVVCATACQHSSAATGGSAAASQQTVAPPATGSPVVAPTAAPPVSAVRSAGPSTSVATAMPSRCRARGSGLEVLPDPLCTPGATNPAVTPGDIDKTICASGWTRTVRPPVSYTEPLKYEQMAAYGDTGPVSSYEEDHLIPLELGGSPSSPSNLWPEPGASPNPKDSVESAARQAVCDGRIPLAAAQRAIAVDWITFGRQLGVSLNPAGRSSGGQGGSCTADASFNSRYGDWDVYVHSNQPDQTATVTVGTTTASWHTDSSGYADVYLHAPQSAAGQRATVTVGSASCSTTL
jgi:hypothetical protein